MPLDEAPFFYTKRRIHVPAEYERDDFLIGESNVQQWGPVERGGDCSKFKKGFFRARFDWGPTRERRWEDRSERFHRNDMQRSIELQRQSKRVHYDIITGDPQNNYYTSQSRFHPSGRRLVVPETNTLEVTKRMRDTSLRYHRPPSATLNNHDLEHRRNVLLEGGLVDLDEKRTSSILGLDNDKIPSLGAAEAFSQSNYGGLRPASILDYARHEKRTYASIVDSSQKYKRDPLNAPNVVQTSSGYAPDKSLRAHTAIPRSRNDTTFHLYHENIKKISTLESKSTNGDNIISMSTTLRPNTALGLTYRSTYREGSGLSATQDEQDENTAPEDGERMSVQNHRRPATATNGGINVQNTRTRPITSPGSLQTLRASGYTRSRHFPYYERVDSTLSNTHTLDIFSEGEEEVTNYNEALYLTRSQNKVLEAMFPTDQELNTLRAEITPQGKSGIPDRTVWDVALTSEDIHRRQRALRRQPNRVFDTTSEPQILPVIPNREARGARELKEILRSRPARPIDRPASFTHTAAMLRQSRVLAQKREDIEAVRRLPLNVMD